MAQQKNGKNINRGNKGQTVRSSTTKRSPHVAVKLRNDWYRDSFKKIVTILLVSLSLNVLFGAFVGYKYMNPDRPLYFSTNDAGQLTPIVALKEPKLSASSIVQFSADAIREIYSFDYLNYKEQLNKSGRDYFTAQGFDMFVKALTDSGNLDAVKAKRLIVKTIITGVPIISKQGVLNGKYSWKVEVPVTIHYSGSEIQRKEDHIIIVTLQRMDVLSSSKGIGIVSFLVS